MASDFGCENGGLPGVSGKRGDLYVEVQINLPKKLTEREREIWNELAKLAQWLSREYYLDFCYQKLQQSNPIFIRICLMSRKPGLVKLLTFPNLS